MMSRLTSCMDIWQTRSWARSTNACAPRSLPAPRFHKQMQTICVRRSTIRASATTSTEFAKDSAFVEQAEDGAFILHPLLASLLLGRAAERRDVLLMHVAARTRRVAISNARRNCTWHAEISNRLRVRWAALRL